MFGLIYIYTAKTKCVPIFDHATQLQYLSLRESLGEDYLFCEGLIESCDHSSTI